MLDNFVLNLSGLLSALLTVPPTLSHPRARVGWLWCRNGEASQSTYAGPPILDPSRP
jgi:hypothetical protein